MKKNDDKILSLKAQIAKKKELLKSSKKFSPVTNCNLTLNGTRVNLHTLTSADDIMNVMVGMNETGGYSNYMEGTDGFSTNCITYIHLACLLKYLLESNNKKYLEIIHEQYLKRLDK